jgi:NodT family efflux transporter outer membrane factor (OMF) lipoprotein
MRAKRPRRGLLGAGRGAALLTGALALSGCMVGPDFKRPEVPVPPKWSTSDEARIATQTAADALWWKQFKDPVLDHLVDLAYGQNLPLQVAGLRIAEARAQLGVTTGKQWPQVQVVTAAGSADGVTKSVATYADLDRHFFSYQIGFDAAWELDFWGKYGRAVQSAEADVLASVADYYSSIVSLSAEVARTYTLIRTYEVLLGLAQTNITVQENGLEIAESRFRNGATSELDVAQATTLLESTRASVPRLQTSAQQARNALSTLLGQTAGSVETMLGGPKEIPKAPDSVSVSVPAEMLRRRPDIRRAELLAAAQCARIGVAKAELYPSFSLFGSIGFQAMSTGAGSHNLFSPDNLVYSVGPRVTWPFFNYGRLESNVRVQDARLQQLLVGYRDTVIRAAQEVEDALVGFVNSRLTQASEQASVQAAQRAEELALIQYREGAVDYQRVLDAQRVLLQEQNNLAQALSALATNVIAVYKALGGGWEPRRGQAFVPLSMQKEMKERTNWSDVLSEPSSPEAEKNPPPPPPSNR